MNLLKCGCLVLLTTCFIADAAHARNDASGAYVGATVAQTQFDRDIGRLNDELAVVNPSETTLDANSLGYSVYGGYRFNKYLAVDGGYMHFGKVHYHAGYRQGEVSCSGGCTPRLFAPADITINTYGVRVLARGTLPLMPRWTLDAHLGAGIAGFSVNDESIYRSDVFNLDLDPQVRFYALLGVGTSVGITHRIWSRFEWSHGGTHGGPPYGPGSYNSVALSVEYRFW